MLACGRPFCRLSDCRPCSGLADSAMQKQICHACSVHHRTRRSPEGGASARSTKSQAGRFARRVHGLELWCSSGWQPL